MNDLILLHPDDTVAVVTKSVSKGEHLAYSLDGQTMAVKVLDDIPVYHKIAVKSAEKGASVLKYGEIIGCATADIRTGDHVHTHNLSDLFKSGERI
jgi:altronate dehydratase